MIGTREGPSRHVFISYVSEDRQRVEHLATALSEFGVEVWLDRRRLPAGSDWKTEIRSAIRSGMYFVACFSRASLTKDRSYMREEVSLAIEEMRLRSPHQTWFIPVKLDDCEIPDLAIGPDLRLTDIHYLDLSSDPIRGAMTLASSVRPSLTVSENLRQRAERAREESTDAAIQLLSLAIDAEPTNKQALEDRGRLHVAQGNYLAAVADLEKAAVTGESPSARLDLGRALWLASLDDEALAAFSRSLRFEPDSVLATYDRGALLYSHGRMEEAATVLHRAYSLVPTDVNLAVAALRPLLHLRDGDRVLELVAQVQQTHDHPDIHEAEAIGLIVKWRLHDIFRTSDKPIRQPRSVEEVLRQSREQTEAMVADMPRRRELRAQVAERIERSVAGDRNNAARLYRACALYGHIHDDDRSGLHAERGLELAPHSPAMHLAMAYACEYAWGKTRMAECSQHYAAASGDLYSDPLILEEPLPRPAGDDRSPYPSVRRYCLVRPAVGGVMVASAMPF